MRFLRRLWTSTILAEIIRVQAGGNDSRQNLVRTILIKGTEDERCITEGNFTSSILF